MASTFRTVGSKDMTVVQICQEYTSINPAKIHKPSFVLVAPTVLTFVTSMLCSCKETFKSYTIYSVAVHLTGRFYRITQEYLYIGCQTPVGILEWAILNYMKPSKC